MEAPTTSAASQKLSAQMWIASTRLRPAGGFEEERTGHVSAPPALHLQLPVPVPIAISLAGLDRNVKAPWGAGARAAINWAGATGWRAITLDATAPDTRPRALDSSARRDLAAALRRAELAFAGLDLWIPAEHFTRPDAIDRAIAAATSACDLAAALHTLAGAPPGGGAVNLTLPAEAPEARAALGAAAHRCGVRIADTTWPPAPDLDEALSLGLDPAAILLAGADPIQAAAQHGATCASARLTDLAPIGRVAPGAGRLDVDAYLITLDVAGFNGHAVLDLRGVPDQARAAATVSGRFTT